MGMVTVSSVSSQNRNGKWEVSCLFTELKMRERHTRIYSDCGFESQDDALLHVATFKQCIKYYTVHKFNM